MIGCPVARHCDPQPMTAGLGKGIEGRAILAKMPYLLMRRALDVRPWSDAA
ncbi:hypothetical protein [Nonomuraea wenchangensis]|uniref:hypothetical protein n=1 Tax=Nonomuraea wenchangensis TaxID=568860 RepID=UPI00343549B0